ncbi:hypothetical protein [Roseospirillum parvum]|uniref:Phage protein n=1 Tax=Roseospirillum parvum TaxID=83401 RepID=A0A1G8GGF3_9PROT|nr:hypothetical protein [Roseospirillum parvum]SDH93462.1 hypothetical protein SAMN05421742_1273 [Roseospirillum parvum]
MVNLDPARVRREQLRWILILAMYNAQPQELQESVMLATVRAIYPDATPLELRKNLDYLADRDLVELRKEPSGVWWGNLTRVGTDIAEYTCDCQPGIARPPMYW